MDRLSILFVNAATDGVVCNLTEIFSFKDMKDFEDDPLGAIAHLRAEAKAHMVQMSPDPGSVQSWSASIVFTRLAENDPDTVGSRISPWLAKGSEMENIEFKSTMWMDLNRKEKGAYKNAAELKSKPVCNSSMKTICGYLNETGGKLLIGVADNGSVVGIEEEFFVTCPKDQTIDGWLQQARSTVYSFFHEPDEVWQHLKIEIGKLNDKHIAVFSVVPRKKLSLCKCKKMQDMKVYARKATSTDEIKLTGIEAYVLGRGSQTN